MFRSFCLSILLICPLLHAEDPWGKDVPLCRRSPKRPIASTSPVELLIRFHQQYISEADGPRSHFVPSSSEYMRQAVARWGMGMGVLLGFDRLLRENNDPWIYKTKKVRCGFLKWDPVPLDSNGGY